jgi:hypothetical protein
MPTPEEYRQYADICVELANDTQDKAERGILLSIATQFRRIANLQDKRARLVTEPQE